MRGGVAFAFALLTCALAGCVEETLEVVLRVDSGRTVVIDDARFYDGTVLVEAGGSLVLDHADVRISQALVVLPGGHVTAEASAVTFDGSYARNDIETSGTISFTDTTVTGLRDLEVLEGAASLLRGSVEATHVSVAGGALSSSGTSFAVSYDEQDSGWGTSDEAIEIASGSLVLENANIDLVARTGVKAMGGSSLWRNVSLDADVDNVALEIHGGEHEMRTVEARTETGFLRMDGGALRLLDTPIPLPQTARGIDIATPSGGRLEVGWTLTVHAVTLPGNLPVKGLNVTLTSAHEPTTTASAVTDENGDARFDAIQYVADGTDSRSGNPHVARADDRGTRGVAPAIVVEAPTTVMMPVLGAVLEVEGIASATLR